MTLTPGEETLQTAMGTLLNPAGNQGLGFRVAGSRFPSSPFNKKGYAFSCYLVLLWGTQRERRAKGNGEPRDPAGGLTGLGFLGLGV